MSSPISGFTAIPNPQMLAFMPIQSYLMMYFAGSGWQYGKRKISAMSNAQFNKLTPEELLQQHSIELKNMLPTLDKTLNDVTPLIKTLVEQYGDFVREAIKAIPDAIGNIFQQSGQVGQGQITNVRLSQGGLQAQRGEGLIRELYAGGQKSLYEQDLIQQGFTKDTSGTYGKESEAFKSLQEQRRKDERARLIAKSKSLVLKGAIQEAEERTGTLFKKKASRSAVLERNKLTRDIALATNQSRARGAHSTPAMSRQTAMLKTKIRKLQTDLVQLLNRFRW